MPLLFQVASEADGDLIDALHHQCFRMPTEIGALNRARFGTSAYRVIRDEGRIVGTLAILPFRQAWGGRWLSMAGISAVAIAPDRRGTGLADHMLRCCLREARELGFALSVLYPATQAPYRKVGFEQSGVNQRLRFNLDQIHISEHRLPATPVATDDPSPFAAIYARLAPHPDGWLDRSPAAWIRILRPRGVATFGYLLGPPDAPEGYTIFHHADGDGFRHSLAIMEFVALNPSALRRGWTLLHDHRSIATFATMPGSHPDPRAAILPEQVVTTEGGLHWMLRVVNPRSALEGRGYDQDGELLFHLDDPLLPEDSGAWRLRVEGGQGRLERPPHAGGSALRMGPRGLAALFGGLYDVSCLPGIGLVEGDAAALRAATRLFPRRHAFMPDRF